MWAGAVVGVKAFGNIIINKLISSYYQSPDVFALLAHFQNLLGIFLSVPADGINQGIVKYLSDKNLKKADYYNYYYAGLFLNLLVFLGCFLSLWFYKDYFTTVFSITENRNFWIFGIAAVILAQLLTLYFQSLLLAFQELKIYALLNAAGIISAVAFCYFALVNFNFPVVLLAVGLGNSGLFLINIIFIVKRHFPTISIGKPKKEAIKKLGDFVLMALSILVFGKMVDFVIRQFAMNSFSTYQTGLWQTVVKFSDYYTAAFGSLIAMVYFPKISEYINDFNELKKYVREVAMIIVPLIASGLIGIYFLREYILVLFFDEHFRSAEKFFLFQLIGDFLKMTSFLLAYLINAQARTTLFIISQGLSAALYVGLIFLCSSFIGIDGFPLAHTLRYIVYCIFIVGLYRKLIFS